MTEQAYKDFCQTMGKRGGRYPGMDIPEFYALAEMLFTPDEAAVAVAMPRGYSEAKTVAEAMGRDAAEVSALMERMADKGLLTAGAFGEATFFGLPMFVPGIFEFQFMRGTNTDRDRRLARLIHDYKAAVDAVKGPPKITFPTTRAIVVDRKVKAGNTIHTYDQVKTYIEKYAPLSVSTCFCRHEAQLLDENDTCGKPNEVCMQFGMGAQFIIDRGMGRKISKDEAVKILDMAEEAGLVHASINRQEIDFLCNCCKCHCMITKTALAQPKPALALNSGFLPVFDAETCTACETCVERCPADALALGPEDVPELDLDRCFGCGVCATGCPTDSILMEAKPDAPEPPLDQKALKEAVRAARAEGFV